MNSLRAADEAERQYDSDPSPENRTVMHRFRAEYHLRLSMEEDFWKQKAAVRWVSEGERNTQFFQGFAKQKRCQSNIYSIEDGGTTIAVESDIRLSAVNFFRTLLTSDGDVLVPPDDTCFPSIPCSFDSDSLCVPLSPQEIRDAVFDIDPHNASGPDGFSSLFFQHCWEIVSSDVEGDVLEFFDGHPMPPAFTATTVVLISKKPVPSGWSDYRPTSLCNVTNKIIMKILNARPAPLLPLIISPNQSGFFHGRVITDNILLAQELIHDLHVADIHGVPNLALKLDMAKAYDRVH